MEREREGKQVSKLPPGRERERERERERLLPFSLRFVAVAAMCK